ncbi:hypothetical protein RHSIM_Rhsim09G0191500 [Rhododendron simsii]|uniref:Uncharacterized protein n=1 Tax=Rhododendron simsii TaxID=118357 RepID=A0A834LES2_RHOSS|nr:hypothetical protein RHSIM_Rhsim09G0191500 [Rhododendron simsii]
MGLITSSFPFIVGTVCGIYIAQNYDVPNIKKVFNDAFSKAKHVEETGIDASIFSENLDQKDLYIRKKYVSQSHKLFYDMTNAVVYGIGELLDKFPDGVGMQHLIMGFAGVQETGRVWCLITLSALSLDSITNTLERSPSKMMKDKTEYGEGAVLLKLKLFAVYILCYVQWCLDGRYSDIGLLVPEKRRGSCLVIYSLRKILCLRHPNPVIPVDVLFHSSWFDTLILLSCSLLFSQSFGHLGTFLPSIV